METPNTPCGDVMEDGWPVTELESLARDMVDVGVWETAEEETHHCRALLDGEPDTEPGETAYAANG